MDITDYIFARREEVLVAGDYNGYRAHTTRKLHNIRKKLGQTTPKGRKYTSKPPISAEDVGQNVAYVSNRELLSFFITRANEQLLAATSISSFLVQNGHGLKRCT